MSNHNDPFLQVETTSGSLIEQLQIIWDEVGETDTDKDKMLLELEQECLQVYRRKVDEANRCRAHLRQTIADYEAELAAICSAMAEPPVHNRQSDQTAGNLKEELRNILPQLEEMRKRKSDRKEQFVQVLEQIQMIKNEIYRSTIYISSKTVVDETDLSLRKLEEFHRELHELQKEKSDRMKQVQDHLNTLNSFCSVLGMDFKLTVSQIHPSFGNSDGSRSISDDTIEQLTIAIQKLREVKIQRMQKLQDLATTMLELWNLMDTPIEEQQMFQNVTCNIAASEREITERNTLSVDFIDHVEAEVTRLEELKSSKMKELVLKKQSELEEICRKNHMVPENDSSMEYTLEAIESGTTDPANVLEQIELQIAKAKEEAFSRKDILEKIDKWLAAREEESWLEDYNRDENRYNAGRGSHLILKRAEKARSLVNKLPGMVETLASKTSAWETERGVEFLYDGVRLHSMLDEYTILRQEKEQERRRQRDQKKLKEQLIAEQEALYGSKPSPLKAQSVKKVPRVSSGGANNRRLPVGGTMLQTPKPDSLGSIKATPHSHPIKKIDRTLQHDPSNLHPDDGCATESAGRRGLDIPGEPKKKQSSDASEQDSPMKRRPFSAINSTTSSNDVNPNGETVQKPDPPFDLSFTTPSNTNSFIDDENMTPKSMPIPVPPTPPTISVPMQTTTTTPAPADALIPFNVYQVVETAEGIDEYSFEERRAGFVLPEIHSKPSIQV
ncbi:65-kDa microtubule-associated protein 3 [Citrus sinensis]|uniref:65-kDa microtubule-associated protein 3 n=2 Tax=Citrus sinensis TaxID=2711 RepID=A0ACB8IJQ4_CITSI|nr:65-kDa microtubule-associated protein 3 [Citrus sinensis]